MTDEGYIKFQLNWKQTPPLPADYLQEIIYYRNLCFQKKFIGCSNGVSFGNISVRYDNTDQFIISGTQTGAVAKVSLKHFTLVTKVDLQKNSAICEGPVRASAESLTHSVLYSLDKKVEAVIHIHDEEMWKRLKHIAPTTDETILYGTPEMGIEVQRLYQQKELQKKKILIMAGHRDGIIAFGKNLKEAFNILLAAEQN